MEEDEFNIKAYTEALLHVYSTPDAIMPTLHTNWPQNSYETNADYYINTSGQVSSGNKFLGNKFIKTTAGIMHSSNTETHNDVVYEDFDKQYEIWSKENPERRDYQQMRLMQLLKPVQPKDGVDIADIW